MSQGAATLSEETKSYLAEVKKGKSRRFVLVAKGSNIVSLIVYKKGSLEKFKKEAKESGKGQFYFGVADGSGPSIQFKLAIEDGFSDTPVKNTVLKAFLTDGGFKCIPEFVIVPTLPSIDDEDVAVPQSTDAGASTDAANSNGVPSDSDTDSAKYKSQLTLFLDKLVPAIKRTLAVAPDRKEELLRPIAGVKALIASDLISAQQFEEAKGSLLAVGILLKQLSANEQSTTEQSSISEGEKDPLDVEWTELRGRVVANLKKLASVIASTKNPKAASAIAELKAVIGNLPESVESKSKSQVLQYLNSDPVVDDICRIAFDFRTAISTQLERLATEN